MARLGAPIVIDGSYGEGGGALLRTALVMAALTQQPLRVEGVRGGTKYPGLDGEDVILLRALVRSCSAEATGMEAGSTSVSFLPTKRARALNEALDMPEDEASKRGASALVILGSLLPVLARTGAYSRVSLKGETYGHNVLSFDYFYNVTIAALKKFGLYAFPDQELAGFGRESRGDVVVDVEPSALQGVDWSTRGKMVGLRAVVTTAEIPVSVGQRGVSHLEQLAKSANLPIEVEFNPVDSRNAGAFVTVWCSFERGVGGATAMGQRGLKIETLATHAFEETFNWMSTEATVDPFLADQLLVTAALADGTTVFKVNRLTSRFLTSVWVIKQFLPIHITVIGQENSAGTVTIKR